MGRISYQQASVGVIREWQQSDLVTSGRSHVASLTGVIGAVSSMRTLYGTDV